VPTIILAACLRMTKFTVIVVNCEIFAKKAGIFLIGTNSLNEAG